MIPNSEVTSILKEYNSLVRSIAYSACCSSNSLDFYDLCQVGDIAVLRAIKAYDPTHGTTIKSFVSRIVKQDIYNEAARFLGIFTVDPRVTLLAGKANKLRNGGKTDEEIAIILSGMSNRNFDAAHVQDLHVAYNRRRHADIESDDLEEPFQVDEKMVLELLNGVVKNEAERIILENRLIKNKSINVVAKKLGLTNKQVYSLEAGLRSRIMQAIKEATE